MIVYRCLHGWDPRYLADHLIPASDAAPRSLRLRSANLNRLTVPRCRLSTYGCRGLFITLGRQPGTRYRMNLEIPTVLMALNDS